MQQQVRLKINDMKKIILIVALISASSYASAQQDAMFTHYAYNTLAVNPAYAGTRDALSITALSRFQWVGFDGAPNTQTITLHTPFYSDKLGAGLSILNDNIGPVNNTAITADFAYHMQVSETDKLSFGLKGGINLFSGDFASIATTTENDESFNNKVTNAIDPNFGFGLYYHSTKWYVGASAPRVLENDILSGAATLTNVGLQQRHFFLIAGAVFDLNKRGTVKLKPTTLVKMTQGAPIQGDLTAMFILNDKLELGAMYRTMDAAGVLVGINIQPNFRVGYSFDWSMVNSTGRYNAGSHELMLRYEFNYANKGKIVSPRYF